MPVQQQQNGFDCGVYAIAFMVSFVNKEDLASISFDEKELGDHLYDCYKQGRLIPFLSAKKNVRRNTVKSISFELFCSCRIPWAKQNARSVERQIWQNMITVCNGSIENAKEFQIRFSKGQWNG